jgi:hypothetical protein
VVAALESAETAQRAGLKAMPSRLFQAIAGLIALVEVKPHHSWFPAGVRAAEARRQGSECSRRRTRSAPLMTAWSAVCPRQGEFVSANRHGALVALGVVSLSIEIGVAVAGPMHSAPSGIAERHAADIAEASQRFHIPEPWIHAVLQAESAGNVGAISSAGAIGLMQVMPATWTELQNRYGLGRDPYNPRDNILAGTAYLREMFDRYGNVAAMLAAYNAGPGRYEEYLATGRALPAETRAYVAALVPVLGGAAASEPLSSAPPPSPDWREAPLFVKRSGDARAVATPPSNAQFGDARMTILVDDATNAESHRHSIFVARASDGSSP